MSSVLNSMNDSQEPSTKGGTKTTKTTAKKVSSQPVSKVKKERKTRKKSSDLVETKKTQTSNKMAATGRKAAIKSQTKTSIISEKAKESARKTVDEFRTAKTQYMVEYMAEKEVEDAEIFCGFVEQLHNVSETNDLGLLNDGDREYLERIDAGEDPNEVAQDIWGIDTSDNEEEEKETQEKKPSQLPSHQEIMSDFFSAFKG